MKCGREIPAGRVFCEACLTDMEKYPVKPGTAIRIPARQEDSPVRKQPTHRKQLSAEEQIRSLKRRLLVLGVLFALLLAVFSGCLYLAMTYIWENEGKPLPGQNYSTVETAAPKAETESN